jgi:gliding motility-associated-like protein
MGYKHFLQIQLTILFCCWFLAGYGQVVINEYTCSNKDNYLDNFGDYEDWIEFYNTGPSAVNISGFFLTDKVGDRDKWTFPIGSTISAGGILRVFASGRDTVLLGNIHTSFKLTQMKQEYIILSNAIDTAVVDSVWLNEPTQKNHSRGRDTDGAANWEVFPSPTPNASNNSAVGYSNYAPKPIFGIAPGFYPGAITLSLNALGVGVSIRYTIDGSDPIASSTLYTVPFNISTTTIIRAKSFGSSPNVHQSFTESNTYFINESHTMPVISVASADFPDLFTGTPEIMSSCEYFDKNKQFQFEMDGDFRGHGNDSWAYDQKGIRFYARDQYGYANKIDHKLFSSSTRTDFDVVIFRNAGSDNYPGGSIVSSRPTCHMRDGYIQTLAKEHDLNVDTRKYESCIVYLNGEYWGLYEMRERIDKDYTKYYHGQGQKWLDMLEYWGALDVRYGTTLDWDALYTYMTSNNLAIPANYNYVISEIDEMSFLDYFILNTHIVNTDWLNWNTKWWRGKKGPNPTGWRYTFWDMDNTFNLGQNYTGMGTTTYLNDPCDPQLLFPGDPDIPHMDMINALLANPTFYDLYVNRYADLLNTTLNCDTMLTHFDAMIADLAVEMPQQIARWGGTMAEWNTNVQTMRSEIVGRCAVIDSLLIGCYQPDIGPKADLTVNVVPIGAGSVKVNTITPNTYPWTGDYFTGVNVSFQANGSAGYVFDHWEVFTHIPVPGNLVDSIYFAFTAADSVVAVFVPVLTVSGTTTNDNCNGSGMGTINLAVMGGSAPFTFNWSNGATDQNLTGLQAGIYDVTLTDANSTDTTQNFVIANNSIPTVTSSSLNDDCYSSGSGLANINVIGGAGAYTFSWSNGSNTEDILNIVAGNYTVTITDAANCTLTESVVVNQDSLPTANASMQNVSCFGETDGLIDVTVSGGISPYTYVWDNGLGNNEDLNNLTAGIYNLTVTDANNCSVSLSTALVEPTALALTLDVTNTGTGSDGQIMVVSNGGTTPYTYSWNDPLTQSSSTAIGLAPGNYQVIVIDSEGCQKSAQAMVELEGIDCVHPVMTFTPNGDGVNDTWVMDCVFNFEHQISVYNRWGQVVFQTSSYDSMWDATMNGERLPDGGYFFTIEIRDQHGKKQMLQGALNIIR